MYDFNDMFAQIRQQNQAISAREMARVDIQKGWIQQDSIGGIFDQIGSAFGSIMNSFAASSYQEDMQAAKAQARANAIAVSRAQQESNLKIAQFQADLFNQNAQYLKGTAYNQAGALMRTYEQGQIQKSRTMGQAQGQFAASGIQVNTSSAADVLANISKVSDKEIQNNYFAGINEINKTLAEKASQETNALFTIFEAKERNRFIEANAQMQVY